MSVHIKGWIKDKNAEKMEHKSLTIARKSIKYLGLSVIWNVHYKKNPIKLWETETWINIPRGLIKILWRRKPLLPN